MCGNVRESQGDGKKARENSHGNGFLHAVPDCFGKGWPCVQRSKRKIPPIVLIAHRNFYSSLKPQAHIMTPSFRLRMILERRAVVQDPTVVVEEHLPCLQIELYPEFGAA